MLQELVGRGISVQGFISRVSTKLEILRSESFHGLDNLFASSSLGGFETLQAPDRKSKNKWVCKRSCKSSKAAVFGVEGFFLSSLLLSSLKLIDVDRVV